MSDRKTVPTEASADEVIEATADPRRRADAREALRLIREVTGAEPVVWGPSMIGFGRQPYTRPRTARSASGSPSGWRRARPRSRSTG